MKTQNIALIFGGCSPEYNVSLKSAYAIIKHMNMKKYKPILIGISPSGDWYHFKGNIEKIPQNNWCNATDCIPAVMSLNRTVHELLLMYANRTETLPIHAAFPVLHGKNGEDGTIQGLLELAGIPIIGCGVLASALCMDKIRAHKLVENAGIQTPKSYVVTASVSDKEYINFAKNLAYPLFIKPLKAGSSYGITKVHNETELLPAVKLAYQYDNQVIMEENISGFEVGCAIIGNEELIVGAIDEVELESGFFDFTEKYTLQSSSIYVPARISQDKCTEIKQTAQKIYRVLGCHGFARVDLFLTSTGELFFNEVNTIPGFTAHSRFPNMLKAAGMTFEEIIDAVIDTAIKP